MSEQFIYFYIGLFLGIILWTWVILRSIKRKQRILTFIFLFMVAYDYMAPLSMQPFIVDVYLIPIFQILYLVVDRIIEKKKIKFKLSICAKP